MSHDHTIELKFNRYLETGTPMQIVLNWDGALLSEKIVKAS